MQSNNLTLGDLSSLSKDVPFSANRPWSSSEINQFNVQERAHEIKAMERFKKDSKLEKVVLVELTTDTGVWKAYYFLDVYECIKHLKNVKFIKSLNVLTLESYKKDMYVKCAKMQKRTLKDNVFIDLNEDHFKIV
jgi:hypothetical protein